MMFLHRSWRKNPVILIFDDVEVLDFAGPFEIFSATNELNDNELLNVYTIALTKDPILTKNGLQVVADYTLDNRPEADYFIIPGGSGFGRSAGNNCHDFPFGGKGLKVLLFVLVIGNHSITGCIAFKVV